MKIVKLGLILAILAAFIVPAIVRAQSDPGVRPGAINGQSGATATSPLPLPSVLQNNPAGSLEFFQNGLTRFQAVESVSNSPTGNNGLGPRFNLNQCSGCHSQPSIGGSSPASNLEFQVITVSGRSDAGNCSLPQPSFSTAQQTNNIIFRIPTPVFGAGLIENIDDSTLLANHSAQASNNFGIGGTFNHNGNDGTIARFGWKAQNKSLVLFSGEAYNVEMGISNEIFGQDRPLPGEDQLGSGLPSSCLNLSGTGYPEDITNFSPTVSSSDSFAQNASINSDVVAFAEFMRMLAPPIPSSTTPGGATSISNGRALFNSIGCATCHTPTINSTQPSNITSSLGRSPVSAFSDIEIHHMGTGLTDNVSQGGAGGDQFRTAPLWGLGQRIFFLHDGRTSNLLSAIEAHQSSGSEATQVEENFDALSPSQQQDLLNFLRSL